MVNGLAIVLESFKWEYLSLILLSLASSQPGYRNAGRESTGLSIIPLLRAAILASISYSPPLGKYAVDP